MRNYIIIILILISSSLRAQNSDVGSAPLGLKWGMTRQEAEALGVKFGAAASAKAGQSYPATNLPKVLSDTESVHLYFTQDGRLWRITSVSNTWRNDQYGTAASQRYAELSKLLTERYGRGQSLDFLSSDNFFRDPSRYSYGIYKNERTVATNWITQTMFVQLAIRSVSTDDLYYILIYENKELAKIQEKDKNIREKDAL